MDETEIQRPAGRRWGWWLGAAAAAALALRLTFFGVGLAHVQPSADESIIALQAKHIGSFDRFPLLFSAQPYMFPLEAYLYAPLSRVLPVGALGARFGALLLTLAGVGFFLAALRRWGAWREVWPGALLALFPSAYVLIHQGGYALPGYPSFIFLFGLCAWLLQVASGRGAFSGWRLAAGTGLAAGLACSVSLLAAPLAAGCAALFAAGGNWRRSWRNGAAFVAGAAAGFLPHLVARWLLPGAYAAVEGRFPLRQALERLWEPALTFTLPVASGFQCTLFPDNPVEIDLAPLAFRAFPYVWLALTAAGAVIGLVKFIRSFRGRRWPQLDFGDLFTAVALGSLFLFLVAKRADSHAFRYLLPAALCLPFQWVYVHRRLPCGGRIASGALAVAVAALNVASGAAVMKAWTKPGFAESVWLPDVRPAIETLAAKDIRHAYASYHLAYRLRYLTGERMLCDQYYNERFPFWPLPYRREIDRADRVAFVLTDIYGIKPEWLLKDLTNGHAVARVERAGPFTIFSDFVYSPPNPEQPLVRRGVTARTDSHPMTAGHLVDGRVESRWRSHREQEAGLSVELEWPSDQTFTAVRLLYTGYPTDRANALDVLVETGDGWRTVRANVPREDDAFVWRNGHPVLGEVSQIIRFDPVAGRRLRIRIADPVRGRDWTIGEVEVFGVPGADEPAEGAVGGGGGGGARDG